VREGLLSHLVVASRRVGLRMASSPLLSSSLACHCHCHSPSRPLQKPRVPDDERVLTTVDQGLRRVEIHPTNSCSWQCHSPRSPSTSTSPSTHDPPGEPLLTELGAGAGAGSSVVGSGGVRGHQSSSLVVPKKCVSLNNEMKREKESIPPCCSPLSLPVSSSSIIPRRWLLARAIHPASARSGGVLWRWSFIVGVVLVPPSLASPSLVHRLTFGAAF
jgi:hypothetical protein